MVEALKPPDPCELSWQPQPGHADEIDFGQAATTYARRIPHLELNLRF